MWDSFTSSRRFWLVKIRYCPYRCQNGTIEHECRCLPFWWKPSRTTLLPPHLLLLPKVQILKPSNPIWKIEGGSQQLVSPRSHTSLCSDGWWIASTLLRVYENKLASRTWTSDRWWLLVVVLWNGVAFWCYKQTMSILCTKLMSSQMLKISIVRQPIYAEAIIYELTG